MLKYKVLSPKQIFENDAKKFYREINKLSFSVEKCHQKKRYRNVGVQSGEMRKATKTLLQDWKHRKKYY